MFYICSNCIYVVFKVQNPDALQYHNHGTGTLIVAITCFWYILMNPKVIQSRCQSMSRMIGSNSHPNSISSRSLGPFQLVITVWNHGIHVNPLKHLVVGEIHLEVGEIHLDHWLPMDSAISSKVSRRSLAAGEVSQGQIQVTNVFFFFRISLGLHVT